jgi:hypothetical protein
MKPFMNNPAPVPVYGHSLPLNINDSLKKPYISLN